VSGFWVQGVDLPEPRLPGAQAAIFARAYSQVPLTTPSHATILTGTYPQFNHVSDLGTPLAENVPYLPEILRQHGYHTAAFVGSQVLDPKEHVQRLALTAVLTPTTLGSTLAGWVRTAITAWNDGA